MKVLVLAPHAFYVERGTPMAVDLLLRALSDAGHEVEACVYHEGEDRAYPGVALHRIRAPGWLRDIGPGLSAKKLVADVYLLALALGVRRRCRPDVVHAGEEAVFIARLFKALFGTPYVYDLDSSIAQQVVEKKPWLGALARPFAALEAMAVRGAAACAPVCPALEEIARGHGARHVQPLPDISELADPDRPATGFLHDRLGLARATPLLLYVGNLEPYQGVELLLRGFAEARRGGTDAALVVAGGTDAHVEAHRRLAERLGIADAAHFLGRWPAERLDELLVEADVLAAPRVRGINTPQKIYPYLHSGRPVLLTDLPTHTQVVDASVCLLAAPEPVAFGRAIRTLVEDPALRRRLGEAGRAFVLAHHTYPAHAERVRRLYGYLERRLGPAPASAPAASDP